MTARDWIAPGVIVAIMTVWLTLSAGRFASIDNQYADIAARIDELEAKLDRSSSVISATDNRHANIANTIAGVEAECAEKNVVELCEISKLLKNCIIRMIQWGAHIPY